MAKKKKRSAQSWFSMSRRVFSRDPTSEFGSDPLLRDLWTTICAWAYWKDGDHVLPKQGVRLTRGQLVTSIPQLCRYCRSSPKPIRNRLNYLLSTGRVEIVSKAGAGLLITVIKYDKHQRLGDQPPVDNSFKKPRSIKAEEGIIPDPQKGRMQNLGSKAEIPDIEDEIIVQEVIMDVDRAEPGQSPDPRKGNINTREYNNTRNIISFSDGSASDTFSSSETPTAEVLATRVVSAAVKTLNWQFELTKGGYKFSSSAHAAAHARKNMGEETWLLFSRHFSSWDHFGREYAEQHARGYAVTHQRRLEQIFYVLALDPIRPTGHNDSNFGKT